ncbi:MAG: DNA helicase II, partial [Roseovarius sp.]|nr:DNA helicase II [Roseovarius sp.]
TPPGLYGGGFGAAAPQSQIHEKAARADVYNSPGWKRMQARQSNRPMAQPQEVRRQVIDLEAVSAFTVGERVFHQKFGYGAITAIEGDKLEIAFEKAGPKKVVARFVTGAGDVPF